MTKVLMVCLGNICRSPLAEGILRAKVDNENITVDSAGTGSYHIGESPDSRSIATAKNHGIDISTLKARQFTAEDFVDFDYIFAMDRSNYKDLLSLAQTKEEKEKVSLISAKSIEYKNREVPDPYFGNLKDFEAVFQMLEEMTTCIVKSLR